MIQFYSVLPAYCRSMQLLYPRDLDTSLASHATLDAMTWYMVLFRVIVLGSHVVDVIGLLNTSSGWHKVVALSMFCLSIRIILFESCCFDTGWYNWCFLLGNGTWYEIFKWLVLIYDMFVHSHSSKSTHSGSNSSGSSGYGGKPSTSGSRYVYFFFFFLRFDFLPLLAGRANCDFECDGKTYKMPITMLSWP